MNGMRRDGLNRKACALFARGGIAAVGYSSMWVDTTGYCGN